MLIFNHNIVVIKKLTNLYQNTVTVNEELKGSVNNFSHFVYMQRYLKVSCLYKYMYM